VQLLIARASGTERELIDTVAPERRVRVAIDETRDRAQPAAVELDELAVEGREIAHPAHSLDRLSVAEDEGVFEYRDVAEGRAAQGRTGSGRRGQLRQIANEQH
jgi:hypothetical protein